ncbi:MAG TPA: DUF192 domain-containing protein [Gaiellaceae bacterium]|nr:DUF192 domain-containing protein [Gaiellaceae bacterium]
MLAPLVAALALVAAPPTFERGTAVVRADRGPVLVRVEIAETPAQRQRGLMFRRSLAPNAGMVFLFPTEVRGPFWMKNTLVPLSIAFYGRDGRIRRILDMTPCRRDPCRLYGPGVAYRGALEVNRGAFRRWGVRVGDRVTVRRP